MNAQIIAHLHELPVTEVEISRIEVRQSIALILLNGCLEVKHRTLMVLQELIDHAPVDEELCGLADAKGAVHVKEGGVRVTHLEGYDGTPLKGWTVVCASRTSDIT